MYDVVENSIQTDKKNLMVLDSIGSTNPALLSTIDVINIIWNGIFYPEPAALNNAYFTTFGWWPFTTRRTSIPFLIQIRVNKEIENRISTLANELFPIDKVYSFTSDWRRNTRESVFIDIASDGFQKLEKK